MEHEFLRSIRTHIFYQRVQWAGFLIWQTGVWAQWLDWKRYFPNFAHSNWHIGLVIATIVIGLPMYFYGLTKIMKPIMAIGIKSWSSSLSETKRALYLAYVALVTVFIWLLGMIIIGIDGRNIIDYRSLVVLAIVSAPWAAYAAELILPHAMPELHKVSSAQNLAKGVSG
jgi:hypothetical protein